MSGFLSSFFRQPSSDAGENGSELKSSGASYVSTSGAASWVTMTQPDGGRGEPMMRVNQDTVDEVLEPLGDEEPVNIIAIFGAARGGKSFLMNQLAGKDGIFKISNEKVRINVFHPSSICVVTFAFQKQVPGMYL